MCDNLIITLMSFMMCAYLENVPCDWIHVTGSCEGIAGALPRVFKLGQASCSSVVLKSYIPTRPVSFGVVDRSALWWQRILVAPGLEGVCVVCVFCVEGQQQRKFPHSKMPSDMSQSFLIIMVVMTLEYGPKLTNLSYSTYFLKVMRNHKSYCIGLRVILNYLVSNALFFLNYPDFDYPEP